MRSCVLRLLLIYMPNNTESICRKAGKKLRRLALHVFIIHCRKKWAQNATSNTLTNPYIRFLQKTQTYLNFMTRTPKSKPCIVTLQKYTVLIHWWVVYAILLLCWSTTCFITLLSWTPTKSHCWTIPNPNTLLRYTLSFFNWLSISQFQHIVELYPILTHCWGIANINTLLSYNLSSYIVKLRSILIYCCQFSLNVGDCQSESSITSPICTIKNWSY